MPPVAYVLVIDDDPEACEVVAGYLTKAGHEVRCVTNGREGLRTIIDEVPDAILLDVLMPGMDGIATLEAIRAYFRWTNVPIAILTAYPEDPRLRDVAQQGVTRVFAKSKVSLDQLLGWVNDQGGEAARPGAGRPLPPQAGP